jgi:hypothetical protein
VLGLAFSVAARVWLGGNWSSVATLKQDHALIRSEWRGTVALAAITAAFLRKIVIE